VKADPFERFKDLSENHCWQYEVRLRNSQVDLDELGKSVLWAEALRTSDFDFAYVDKSDKEQCAEIREFIERHEFLGILPNRPTHRFTARHRSEGTLAGVIVMATPNAFSHLLGKENKNIIKLVSRGASISWAPKNMGSWLVSRACKWMVQNTDFRVFEAYSDPLAKELGTIYQALNWIYLGQTSGTAKVYRDPNALEKGWFSDREFRKKSKYRRYAEAIGIPHEEWKSYLGKYTPKWDTMSPDLKDKIKEQEKLFRESCESRSVPAKHKYCYILGRSKKETKHLRELFIQHNLKKVNLPYPKERGN
jgi:hypothetical protein